MKIISLNLWAGREFDALMKYISEQSKDTDIFCFQEVFDTSSDQIEFKHVSEDKLKTDGHYRANLFSELKKILAEYEGFFAPVQDNFNFDSRLNFPLAFGVAVFIRKNLNIKETGDILIYRERNSGMSSETMPRNLQYVIINKEGIDYVVAHFHGLWSKQGKIDNEDRLIQSKMVKEFLDGLSGRKILCGDFNLLPDTKSLTILEENMINLIKTNNIETTRSSLYIKPERFADYMIVSPDIKVRKFSVPKVEVSDHLPLILEF
jgi:endonuclease/exonuclease/phosphatase family metal-dependent hydrolase